MARKTDRLVTLFGGGGFLGRYVAASLYRGGARVRVAQRDPRQAYFLKPLGGLGQTQFVRADITRPDQVARAVEGSDAVVNLVGTLSGRFHQIHVDGARNAAEAAAAAGVESFVQISAIGADADGESLYASSKGKGELAARAAFATATIIRPSIIFGPEDDFVNRFAQMMRLLPVVPVLRGDFRLQPVYVADVGHAVAAAALDPRAHGGEIYELGGPQILSMRELNRWISDVTERKRRLIDVPDALASLLARVGGLLPGAPITWDQWQMLQQDNIVSPEAKGFPAFGLSPSPLAAVADGWLTAYRRRGRFAVTSPYRSPY